MTKQEFPETVFRILDLNWDENKHTSSGGTVTAQAWKDICDKLLLWEKYGILSVAKGLEKFKES